MWLRRASMHHVVFAAAECLHVHNNVTDHAVSARDASPVVVE